MGQEVVADLVEQFPVDGFLERLVDKLLDAVLRYQRIHAKYIVQQVLLALMADIGLVLL